MDVIRMGFDVGVAAAVVSGNDILLVQEARGTYKGRWGLPKGYVEPDESIENAVLRELKEETGLDGTVEGFIGFRSTKTSDNVGLFLCYSVSVRSDTLLIQEGEIQQAKFVSKDSFSQLEWISPTLRSFAEVAVSGEKLPIVDLSEESQRPYHVVFCDARTSLSKEVDA
jgi:ADP-ribose pyrophosphatase YjhB (NUDIX family)